MVGSRSMASRCGTFTSALSTPNNHGRCAGASGTFGAARFARPFLDQPALKGLFMDYAERLLDAGHRRYRSGAYAYAADTSGRPLGPVGSSAFARGDAGSRGGCRAGAARSVRCSPTAAVRAVHRHTDLVAAAVRSSPNAAEAGSCGNRKPQSPGTSRAPRRGGATSGQAMAEHRATRAGYGQRRSPRRVRVRPADLTHCRTGVKARRGGRIVLIKLDADEFERLASLSPPNGQQEVSLGQESAKSDLDR